jgi:hypothetical protein
MGFGQLEPVEVGIGAMVMERYKPHRLMWNGSGLSFVEDKSGMVFVIAIGLASERG